jgi:hypothetical protein
LQIAKSKEYNMIPNTPDDPYTRLNSFETNEALANQLMIIALSFDQ